MNAYLLMLLIGIVAGLRTFVPVFFVRLPFRDWSTWIAGLAMVLELVADKLPQTPSRTNIGSLVLRCASGAFCAWMVGAPLGVAPALAICFGVAGAIAGAYLGVAWRVRWAIAAKVPAFVAAIIEDAVAIVVAWWVIYGAH